MWDHPWRLLHVCTSSVSNIIDIMHCCQVEVEVADWAISTVCLSGCGHCDIQGHPIVSTDVSLMSIALIPFYKPDG